MNPKKMAFASSLFGALVWLVTAGAGCGEPATPQMVCDKACECNSTSCPPTSNACMNTFTHQQQQAEDAGCVAEFDELMTCFYSEMTCVDGQPSVLPCLDEQAVFDDCLVSEEDDL